MVNLRRYALINDKIVAAHRGASGDYPENSIEAVRKALEQKADMIEVDVQFTKDNKTILFHDNKLHAGDMEYEINELLLNELKEMEKECKIKPHLPLLEDVLKIITGKAYLVLEIKSFSEHTDKKNLSSLLHVLDKYNYKDKTVLASFNYVLLKELKEIDKSLITAAINIPGQNTPPNDIMKKFGCDGFICGAFEMNRSLSEHFKEHNIPAGLYGVDTKDILNNVKDLHIKGFGSNYPALISKALND